MFVLKILSTKSTHDTHDLLVLSSSNDIYNNCSPLVQVAAVAVPVAAAAEEEAEKP